MIELVLTIAILGVMVSIATSWYGDAVDKTNIAIAKSDIQIIDNTLVVYFVENNKYPDSLSDLGLASEVSTDPWGSAYEYLNIANAQGNGQLRKDKNLVPINTDFDLYSKGKDGRTASPLTAQHSRDDIIRANNGGFIGRAEDY